MGSCVLGSIFMLLMIRRAQTILKDNTPKIPFINWSLTNCNFFLVIGELSSLAIFYYIKFGHLPGWMDWYWLPLITFIS